MSIALLFSNSFLLIFSIRKFSLLFLSIIINWFSEYLDSNRSILRLIENFIYSSIISHKFSFLIQIFFQFSKSCSLYNNLWSSNMNQILQFRIIFSHHNSCSWKINFIRKIFNLFFNSFLKFSISKSIKKKKIHMIDFCIKILYHKSISKISNYKKYFILISMIKCIEIDDLISLIFIQFLSSIMINALDFDFIKFIISKIFNYYKNLIEIFFKKESQILSSHKDHLDHHISLKKNIKSIFDFIYNLFEFEFKILKEYIQDNLKKEFIYLFILSFDSSILFIKKFDDNLYLYINYRILNRMIIKNYYLISFIIEIMNRIKDVKYFIKFDIWNIFNHIYIIKENKYKIIFYIKYDHFEYLIIFFDLCNILIIFQFYINDILYEFLDEFCIIYFDDIFIYIDDSLENHINHIHQILQYLLDNNFISNSRNTNFIFKKSNFLILLSHSIIS